MRPLSAIDAISPAWNHTSTLLLKPRDWRLLLKIGAVAIFAGLGGGFSGGGFPWHHDRHIAHLPAVHPLFTAAMVFGILAVFVLSFIIGLALLYLGSRLQFVLFEVLLTRRTTVSPIWARYGSVTWRWIGARLLFVLAALLCLAPVLVPAIIYLVKAFTAASNGSNPFTFVPGMVLTFGVLGMALLVVAAVWVWLSDFGLPNIALDDTSITETVRRVFFLVRAEPGQSVLYLLMRLLLSFACSFVAQIILVLGALVALVPFGVGGGILWMALHNGAALSKAIMITGWVILGLAFLTLLVCAVIMALGYVHAFLKSYALYFLGGRYPRLGEYLDQYGLVPPIPAQFYPQSTPPYAPLHPS